MYPKWDTVSNCFWIHRYDGGNGFLFTTAEIYSRSPPIGLPIYWIATGSNIDLFLNHFFAISFAVFVAGCLWFVESCRLLLV